MSEADDGRSGEELTTALNEEERDQGQREWEDRLPWWQEWADWNTAWLTAACEPEPGPEVRRILDCWEQGGDEKPWQDAQPGGSDEGTEPGEDRDEAA